MTLGISRGRDGAVPSRRHAGEFPRIKQPPAMDRLAVAKSVFGRDPRVGAEET